MSWERNISNILKLQPATLQEAIDGLKSVLAAEGVSSLSLFSPSLMDEGQLTLICSTQEDEPTTESRKDLDRLNSVVTSIRADQKQEIFVLAMRSNTQTVPNDLLGEAITSVLCRVLFAKKQAIRHSVIEQSVRSRDINSFMHRLARVLRDEFAYSSEISVFLKELNKQKIFLSATTGQLVGIQKKDVFYQRSDDTPTSAAIRENRWIIEDDTTGFVREEFDVNIYSDSLSKPLFSRGFWPISLEYSEFKIFSVADFAPLGVVKISNPQRRGKTKTWKTRFTRYDLFMNSYLCEVLFVLIQKYMQLAAKDADIAWLTHGIGANIDASIKFATGLKEALFDNDEENEGPTSSPKFTLLAGDLDGYTSDDIYYDFRELDYFLGDLHFQFTRVDRKSYATEIIDSLHADILIPVLRMSPAIAAVNNKREPIMPNFKKEGSLKLPSIIGNTDAFISVFRNLVENSVKYNRRLRAKIWMQFRVTDNEVVVDYFDNGIGIQDHELDQIFVDGYRSIAARRMNNKGIGIGLSYSRDIMRSFYGDLECLRHEGGAHFKITMKKERV